MGLLGRIKKTPPPADPGITIIAEGSRLEGELSVQGALHIDGTFHGTVLQAENVSVGTAGSFNGRICAKHTLVSGTVDGKVECERIEITETGKVLGEVVCDDFVIEVGGRFFGTSHPRSGEARLLQGPAQAKPAAAKPVTPATSATTAAPAPVTAKPATAPEQPREAAAAMAPRPEPAPRPATTDAPASRPTAPSTEKAATATATAPAPAPDAPADEPPQPDAAIPANSIWPDRGAENSSAYFDYHHRQSGN